MSTIFEDTVTLDASSDGEEDDNEGLLLSTVLKLRVALLEMFQMESTEYQEESDRQSKNKWHP